MATVVLLGKLADLAGSASLALPLPLSAGLDWNGLNGALLPDKMKLEAGAGDEIALLPPVSGG